MQIVRRGFGDGGTISLIVLRGFAVSGVPSDVWSLVTVTDPGGSWSVDTP